MPDIKDIIKFCVESCPYVWPSENIRDEFLYLARGSGSEDLAGIVNLAIIMHKRELRVLEEERAREVRAARRGLWLAPDGSWRQGTRKNNVIVSRSDI